MTELWRLSACDLSRMIHDRSLSPVDLMRAVLARIDTVNPALNAIVALRDREALMGEARLAEALPPEGWLHGIPVAIKDLVNVKGLPTTCGAPPLADAPAAADDGLTARLKEAGAIVIGKTNVPMFGLGSHTTNPVYGPTRNPHDLGRTPGGSSGGAAAALATGMLALADGSDMMGSLRNPAAWCDVYGFRPTMGLVPGEPGTAALTHRLSTLGPMARDIADLEALLVTLSGGVHRPAPDSHASTPAPRIGWLGDWGGAFAMEPGLLDLSHDALARMTELGWWVNEVAPPCPAEMLWQAWTDLRSFAVAMGHLDLWRDPAARATLNAQAVWEIERGLAMTGTRLADALGLRDRWLATLAGLWHEYDALVLPATQVWPFPVEWDWPRQIAGRAMDTYHRWMEVVVPASLAGLPAVGLPAGFGADGLPGGVQLIGPAGADARLLSMARAYAAAIGPRAIVTP